MMFILVLNEENKNSPVDLNEMAKNLENEGFIVNKIVKGRETQLIETDLGVIQNATKTEFIESVIKDAKKKDFKVQRTKSYPGGKLRTKRKIKLGKKKSKGGKGGGGYGGGGSCCRSKNYYNLLHVFEN